MKKYLLLLLLSIAFFSNAQITIPTKVMKVKVPFWYKIATWEGVKLENVSDDTLMYKTDKHPFFVDASVVDQFFNDHAYKDETVINSVTYIPTSQKEFWIYRSGRVDIMQLIYKVDEREIERPTDYKIWYLLKYAKENGYNATTYWNYIDNNILVKNTSYETPTDSTAIE